MSETRKVYDKEFNVRALRMSYETDRISDVAKQLGMRVEPLYHLRAEMQQVESKQYPGHGNKMMTPEDGEGFLVIFTR